MFGRWSRRTTSCLAQENLRQNIAHAMDVLECASLEAMARAAGIHRSSLSRFMRGKTSELGARTLGKLADLCGVMVDTLQGPPEEFKALINAGRSTGDISILFRSVWINRCRNEWSIFAGEMRGNFVMYNRYKPDPHFIQASLLRVGELTANGLAVDMIHPQERDDISAVAIYKGKMFPVREFIYVFAERNDEPCIASMIFHRSSDERKDIVSGHILGTDTRTGVPLIGYFPCTMSRQQVGVIRDWTPMFGSQIGILAEDGVSTRVLDALRRLEQR